MISCFLKKTLSTINIKLIGVILLTPILTSCTGYNSLYPKFTSYQGGDSAVLYVKDDGYNYSIYTFNLTKDGCYEKKERRLLTRNLAMKGSGQEVYEYKVKAGEYYAIGNQQPRKFVYRSFIPELNGRYAVLSNTVLKLSENKDIHNVTTEDINEATRNPALVKGWNIHNICPDIFGYRTID